MSYGRTHYYNPATIDAVNGVASTEHVMVGTGILMATGADDGIWLLYDGSRDAFVLQRVEGSEVDEVASAPVSFGVDDTDFTIVANWTANELSLSIDGGAYVTSPSTTVPQGTMDSKFDIGSKLNDEHGNIDIAWLLFGYTVTPDSQLAGLAALGDTDPVFVDFAKAIGFSFLWFCDDETPEQLAKWGEGVWE